MSPWLTGRLRPQAGATGVGVVVGGFVAGDDVVVDGVGGLVVDVGPADGGATQTL